jgi:L-asparaginase / beta-aspartyl-peptidase
VFIRLSVAHEICARVRLGNRTLAEAVHEVVLDELPAQGGEGGVIAIDREGRIVMEFNSEGMFRASRVAGGEPLVEIYRGS